MGSIAQSNRQINAGVPHEILKIVDERADALSLTRGKYAALVFAWWEAQGCPPVTHADEAVQILKRGKSGAKK